MSLSIFRWKQKYVAVLKICIYILNCNIKFLHEVKNLGPFLLAYPLCLFIVCCCPVLNFTWVACWWVLYQKSIVNMTGLPTTQMSSHGADPCITTLTASVCHRLPVTTLPTWRRIAKIVQTIRVTLEMDLELLWVLL